MSITSGFYNSMNGDRKYTSEQMSAIFDGVITEGIFANIGSCFKVTANNNDNTITVGTGKAWFNSKWILNDTPYKIKMDNADNISDRIDAIAIEINLNASGREALIKSIKGTPSTNPEKPSIQQSDGIYQYPIAYIYRKSESIKISDADIDNIVGTSERPYVADLLEPNKAMYLYSEDTEEVEIKNLINDTQIQSGSIIVDEIRAPGHTTEEECPYMGSKEVKFNKAFSKLPRISTSYINRTEGSEINISVDDITKEGFTIYVHTRAMALVDTGLEVMWIATIV